MLGLCGAVHTGVARSIRNDLQARTESTENTKIACVGDKSRAILQRLFAEKFIFVANEIGRIPPNFLDASKIANNILQADFDFTHGQIIYNKFKSVVSYACSSTPIFSLKAVEKSEKLGVYDSLDADVLKDYLECKRFVFGGINRFAYKIMEFNLFSFDRFIGIVDLLRDEGKCLLGAIVTYDCYGQCIEECR